jgi:hypothetical protein
MHQILIVYIYHLKIQLFLIFEAHIYVKLNRLI